MKSILTLTLIAGFCLCFGLQSLHAQGCVAIRNMSCGAGGPMVGSNSTGLLTTGEWQASIGYRHFKSFRHFRGTEEEAQRVENGTEVINHFNSFDLGIAYGISERLSMTLVLPYTMNDRSSLYEHYGNNVPEGVDPDTYRFHTGSQGIGDLRLGALYWLLDPSTHYKSNIAVGVGIKAPTGNPNVQDDFHKLDENKQDYTIRKAVDQSIQLGDGGWGVNLELQAYQSVFKGGVLYFNGFYLSNPRNVNNTLRSNTADPSNPFSYFSVADQYAMRLGLNYSPLSNFAVSLGGRMEGIPAKDIIGKEEGFRRPGYIVSVEPGVTYFYKQFAFNLNVPVAVERNRIRNVQDIQNGSHGDAAFADYLINASVAFRFGGKHDMIATPSIFNDVSGN